MAADITIRAEKFHEIALPIIALEQIIIKLITLKDLPMCVQIQDNSLKKILDENQQKSPIKSGFLRKYK